jgi:hypothetical protein
MVFPPGEKWRQDRSRMRRRIGGGKDVVAAELNLAADFRRRYHA